MGKLIAKKEVVEQMTSKLKSASKVGSLAENDKKTDLETENSKLQANKNIFARGDFDEYKIKNLGITEDGCTYNLDNPIERYYYELKKELEKKRADSCNEDIEKAYGTKYKSKKLINGKWRYYYADGREENERWYKRDANKNEIRDFIKESCENVDYNEMIKICDLPSHFADKLKLKTGFRMTSLVFESKGVRHSLNFKRHKINPEDILLLRKVIQNKHTIIRNTKPSRQQKKTLIEFTGYSRGVIKFILEVVESKKELRIFDCYREDKLEKSVRFPCTYPETNALDGSQPIIIIDFIDEMSTKINKSLTYSGHKLQGRTKLYGMDISIENKKGSYRSGVDSDGHKWRTYMNYDYGYIRGTEGVDSDHVDVYLGPAKDSNKVYVIHQNNPVTHKYDEDKCMLCFESADAAKKAYMKQYDRPGFFGSMDILDIEQFKTYVFSEMYKGKRIHKSFDIKVTDITEKNKNEKIKQVEKALTSLYQGKEFAIKHIPSDDSAHYEDITLRIRDFDKNSINKAVRKMSFTLDTPLQAAKGEAFIYKSQEELTNKFVKELTDKTKAVYQFVIDYFDLPEMRIAINKAIPLKHKGKILYNPETGKPINRKEWKQFVQKLEEFLNRNYDGIGERIVLSSETLGRILDNLSKTNSLEAIQKMKLSDLVYKHRTFDWISETAKNMKDVFGESISRDRQARVQAAIDSAAQRVTSCTNKMRDDIQQIIIDGVKDRKSKSQISQALFDKCVGENRDFQRVADTEIQNNTTSAYIHEEVYNTADGERVYFKRFEKIDDNTCKKCKELNGKVVLFSEKPLESENIKDEYTDKAIWEGKTTGIPFSTYHPYDRGTWVRYYPDID